MERDQFTCEDCPFQDWNDEQLRRIESQAEEIKQSSRHATDVAWVDCVESYVNKIEERRSQAMIGSEIRMYCGGPVIEKVGFIGLKKILVCGNKSQAEYFAPSFWQRSLSEAKRLKKLRRPEE